MTDTKDKLCPFRKHIISENQKKQESALGWPERDEELFAPCLEDKCQMWRETRDGLITNFGYNEKKDAICYCGLAGKP